MEVEIWKDIEEFNGSYQVSNLGRVRSKERFINTRTYPAQIMKPLIRNNNSVQVRLRNGTSQVTRGVAKLVLLTFVGKPPKNAKQPKHLDGDPNNNCLENLEWDVDKTFGLPPNLKARELFNQEAERMIDIYINKNKYNNISFGEVDIQDFKQECLIAIWNVIDMVDFYDTKSFYAFCAKKSRWVFNKFYRKYKNRHRYINVSSICDVYGEEYSHNMIEFSYIEDFEKIENYNKERE